MLIREPVVFPVLIFEVGIPLLALLLPEIFEVLGTVLGAAELELVARSHARAASVGWAVDTERDTVVSCSISSSMQGGCFYSLSQGLVQSLIAFPLLVLCDL